MHPYEILKRPILTEKSNFQSDYLGQYTFEVDRRQGQHHQRPGEDGTLRPAAGGTNPGLEKSDCHLGAGGAD